MSVSDKIEELKDYYHIGEWLEQAVQDKRELPEILNSIWKKHGAELVNELQSLSEQIELLSDESFKGFSDLVQNKGKLAKLKSSQMAVELQLTNARREMGKLVFEHRDKLKNISDELDQLFDELEHVHEHLTLEEESTTEIQSVKMETSIWPGEYKAGINLFKFITIVGWGFFLGGITVAAIIVLSTIFSEYGAFSLMLLMPTLSSAFAGLLLVGYGQLSRSIMENTNNTREILEIFKSNHAQSSND